MRKSFYHILLLGALTLGTTSSCDDYLEVDHYDILPEDFNTKRYNYVTPIVF